MASWWCGALSARKWRSSSRSSSPVAIRFSTIMFTIDRRKSLSGSSDCFTTANTVPSSLPVPASPLFAFRSKGEGGGGEKFPWPALLSSPPLWKTCCFAGRSGNCGGGGGGGEKLPWPSLLSSPPLCTTRCFTGSGGGGGGGGGEKYSLLVLFLPHDTTLCSSSLSWRSRPEKLVVATAELSRCLLQSTSSSPSSASSSHRKDDDEAEGTVSVPVDPDAEEGCSAAALPLRHVVAVVAVDVSVAVAE
nr:unnamed protein product [Digitaria exilis]